MTAARPLMSPDRAVVQETLFEGPVVLRRGEAPLPLGEFEALRDRGRPKRHRVSRETADVGRARGGRQMSRDDAAVLLEIQSHGELGVTRDKIAERTQLKIQTVCWAVDRLLKRDAVIRVITDHGPPRKYWTRDGSQVLWAELYQRSAEAQIATILHRAP